jgi:hypothetical protein
MRVPRGRKGTRLLLTTQARIRYRWFGSRGLFTGSGVAGAGCKSIVGQRLKQAGMHRTTDGAIIALRCAEASSQREAICNTPHTQTRTD